MLGVLARTFRTASRTETRNRWDSPAHWRASERFDNRRDAEIEAHYARRRT